MAALSRRSDAETLAAAGARRQLLAGWARAVGLRVLRRELDQARRAWLRSSGCAERAGLDAHALDLMLTDHLLEERWLSLAPWAISDGPNIEESLADEARLRHLWAQTAEKLK
ncbi:MAG TPA: hypothetical protein VEY30_13070 [Myxococcaceae bacterium]|nr:hypothetical protein [Myxococcaceae bacterium]